MPEDFEIDTCPRCGSAKVDTCYDEIRQIRLSLSCRNCHYIEAVNPDADPELEGPLRPWETDPDYWKN